jgi:hypothetical protein
MPKNIYDKPSDVVASGGFVLMDGPGSCHVTFTPGAALETASRLQDGARQAIEQGPAEEEDPEREPPPLG